MGEICSTCGLPKEICACEQIAKESQEIKIYTVKRRYGKMVTIVEGIDPGDIDIDDLAQKLKKKCASGGTIKDGNIELQGDHKRKVHETLLELGFSAKIR